jgi:hypothetical protein
LASKEGFDVRAAVETPGMRGGGGAFARPPRRDDPRDVGRALRGGLPARRHPPSPGEGAGHRGAERGGRPAASSTRRRTTIAWSTSPSPGARRSGRSTDAAPAVWSSSAGILRSTPCSAPG